MPNSIKVKPSVKVPTMRAFVDESTDSEDITGSILVYLLLFNARLLVVQFFLFAGY